ncbi:MAG: oligosaccharide flippase family protein [bacterium]
MNRGSVLGKASGAVPWTLVGKAIRFAAGVATSIIVVRHLGREDYGLLAIVRVAAAFIAVPAGVGMGQALLRFLPEVSVREGRLVGRRLLVAGVLVQIAAWALLTFGVFLTGRIWDEFFHAEVTGFILLATILLLAGSLRGFFDSALTAAYEARFLAILGTSGSVMLFGLTAYVLGAGHGIPGILIVTAVAEGAVAICGGIRAFALYSGGHASVGASRLMGYSFPFVLLSLLNMITWKQSETLLLGHFSSASEAGLFDVAYKLPQQLLEFVPESIWPLIMAAMSEAYTKNRAGLANLIDVYYRILFFLVAPLSLFGFVLGDKMITILYGAEWAQAGALTQAFFIIFSISFFGTPLSMAIYVLEKSWANFLLALLFAVVNVTLDLILIPRYGLYGAVVPVAIAIGISPFARWLTLRRFARDITIPWGFIGKAYAVSLPLLALYPLKRFVVDIPSLVAACVVGAALVILAIRVVGLFSIRDRELIERSNLPMKSTLLRVFAGSAA